ncbi:zinc finger protein Paris [Drosophila virilis]|uniref:Protein krueppel n=1 Tax=Drosophila virilis TaxID=7244 RepID=B4LH59_DROVI|nr:zinc finger protein 135 [Drosophila virilis]EDW69549.2 uncharacterized protein Dvir_GJ12064 [Drosophila virilis]
MEQVCRICMSSCVTLVEIFAERQQPEEEPSLAEMLNECVDCEVNPDDPLPKQICLSCVLDAQNAFKFKRTCEQSHQQFCRLLHREGSQADDWHLDACESMELPCVKEEEELETPMPDSWVDNFEENNMLPQGTSLKEEVLSPGISDIAKADATESNHRCTICGQAFAEMILLTEHAAYHRAEDRRFMCTHCPKSYKRRASLQAHMDSHIRERAYKCQDCPKVFVLGYQLKKHMICHAGKRPYACPHCPKAFKNNTNLQSHIRIHSGERPFICSYCSKTFNNPSNLQRHVRLHAEECSRPYRCPYCPKSFTRMLHIKYHLLVHTEESP